MRRATSIFLFLFCAGAGLAREEHSRDFRRTVAMPAGRSFRVENSFGGITIRTHARNEAAISATIKCSADSEQEARTCAEAIRIDVTETGTGVAVRTVYPDQDRTGRRNISRSVTYDLLIPEAAPLEVRNRFGGVDVTGAQGGSVINNAHGPVRFADGRGQQRLENAFGSVEVSRNQGDVAVVNANGGVTLADVSGAVDIRDRFGRVNVARAGGTVTINNGNGSVEVISPGGVTKIGNSFGRVMVTDAKADVDVDNGNGAVEVRNVAGAAELRTTFGSVRFSGIGKHVNVRAGNSPVTGENVGSAVVETSFGAVDLRGVKGGAKVIAGNSSVRLSGVGGEAFAKTSFGGITVEEVAGPVTVENNNGSITVSSKPAKGCQPISLRTSFGTMRVAIPDGAGYNVNARTSFGRITSEHDLTISGAVGGDTLSGRIGAGGCEMQLINSNGGIQIMKNLRTAGSI